MADDTTPMATSIGAQIDQVIGASSTLSPASKKLMEQMYTKFSDRVVPALSQSDDIPVGYWIALVGDTMSPGARFRASGVEKKEILLQVLYLVIDNEVPEATRAGVRGMVDTTVSPAIDLAVYFVYQVKPKCKAACKPCR